MQRNVLTELDFLMLSVRVCNIMFMKRVMFVVTNGATRYTTSFEEWVQSNNYELSC